MIRVKAEDDDHYTQYGIYKIRNEDQVDISMGIEYLYIFFSSNFSFFYKRIIFQVDFFFLFRIQITPEFPSFKFTDLRRNK